MLKVDFHTHTADDPKDYISFSSKELIDRAGELAPAHFTIRRGSMRMRGKDPMGAEFIDMMVEWQTAGHPLNKPLPE